MLKKIINIALAFMIIGCSSTTQLEKVSKDWCLTIRASQIIPVYPLTEDLQPGDVFLVQSPIEDQVKVYKTKGFLKLENLVVRLKPDTYQNFYSSRYGIDDGTIPPRLWPSVKSADFAVAPLSAFPTYSFSVSQKEGLGVALPIQGIPIALNLMGSSNAHGSVSITDSYTYGIDMHRMWQLVNDWANDGSSQLFLKQFAPQKEGDAAKKFHYLRVVNRVYLCKKVKVAIFNDEVLGGQGTGGSEKQTGILKFENYSSSVNTISRVNSLISTFQGGGTGASTIQQVLPGGTLQFAMASSRSVSLDETFNRPLVIGYIAFDLPILADGKLGPPVSTADQLDNKTNLKGTAVTFPYIPDENTNKINNWLLSDKKKNTLLLEKFLESAKMDKKDFWKILYTAEFKELRSEIVKYFHL